MCCNIALRQRPASTNSCIDSHTTTTVAKSLRHNRQFKQLTAVLGRRRNGDIRLCVRDGIVLDHDIGLYGEHAVTTSRTRLCRSRRCPVGPVRSVGADQCLTVGGVVTRWGHCAAAQHKVTQQQRCHHSIMSSMHAAVHLAGSANIEGQAVAVAKFLETGPPWRPGGGGEYRGMGHIVCMQHT